MHGSRIALPLGAAFACAIAALTLVPRGIEAETLLMAQDDPVRLADHALDRSFNADVARREIEAALNAKDADLAQSFLDLARDRKVAVDPALVARVEDANSAQAAAARAAGSFAQGFIVGEPQDFVGLAGTALGDLFVFGDIRDAVREGARMASGEPADELVLGLAGVGIALTAGTYASLGAGGSGAGRALGAEGGAQDRPHDRADEPVCQPLAAGDRGLDGAAPRRRRCQRHASPQPPFARCARR